MSRSKNLFALPADEPLQADPGTEQRMLLPGSTLPLRVSQCSYVAWKVNSSVCSFALASTFLPVADAAVASEVRGRAKAKLEMFDAQSKLLTTGFSFAGCDPAFRCWLETRRRIRGRS